MNEAFKTFLQRNSYQLIAAAFTIVITMFAAYVSYSLFIQSTNLRIEAIQRDVSDVKGAVSDVKDNYVTRNEFIQQQKQLESMDQKLNLLLAK